MRSRPYCLSNKVNREEGGEEFLDTMEEVEEGLAAAAEEGQDEEWGHGEEAPGEGPAEGELVGVAPPAEGYAAPPL